MIRTEEALQCFLQQFFGAGNDITLADIESRQNLSAQCARAWIASYGRTGQLVLPRSSQQRLDWYVIADSSDGLAKLREPLMAFAGPTLSTLRGTTTPLSDDDPLDLSVAHLVAPVDDVYKLSPGEGSQARQHLAQALLRMHSVLGQSHEREFRSAQDTWSLMRDFQISLAAGAVGEARIALDELRRLRRLDAVNLEFLQVKLLAEADDWAAILALDSLPDVINARRTTAVTRALVTAVYRQEMARFEMAGDARAAISHFQTNVWPLYAPLYEGRRGLVEPDVVKSFMLAAIVDHPVRVAQAQELLGIGELGPLHDHWLRSLWAASSSADASRDPMSGARALVLARENLDNRRYDEAIRLLSSQRPSPQVVGGLLECAYELRTNASEAVALGAYAGLSKSDQDALNASRRYSHFLSQIGVNSALAVQAAMPPDDWVGWLERCADRATEEGVLLGWASRGADEWPIATLAADTAKMAAFRHYLQQALDNEEARNVLLRALPDLLGALQSDPDFPRVSLRSTYQVLAEMLVLATNGAAPPAVLDAYVGLIQALLETGLGEDEYEDLLDGLEMLWGDGSARTLPAAVDGLDVFMTFPCPKAHASHREAAAARVLQAASLMRSNGRVDEASWNLAGVIAAELGLRALLDSQRGEGAPEACSTDEQANDWQHLGGLIAVYTLSEQVGVRARQVLQAVAPQCTVKTNSDRAGTDSLRDLAHKADYFVMTTRSAKHAATDCIRRARGARPIIIPEGKGMSSILRALSGSARG